MTLGGDSNSGIGASNLTAASSHKAYLMHGPSLFFIRKEIASMDAISMDDVMNW